MPMPSPDEVRTALSSFGRKIDNFNQSEDGRAFPKNPDLSDGYCEGVVLDWLRRVLQGGRPSFGPKLIADTNPDHEFLQKKQSQAARQSSAFLSWKPTKEHWQNQTPAKLREAERAWGAKQDAILDDLTELEDGLLAKLSAPTSGSITLTARQLALISRFYSRNIPATHSAATIERLYRTIPTKREELIEAGRITPAINKQIELKVHNNLRQSAWQNFAANEDEGSTKKRNFGSISLLFSSVTIPNQTLPSVLQILINCEEKLQNGTGIKMCIGGQRGSEDFFHATACHLISAGRFHFLDPNYGMFEYTQWKTGVVKAIAYLYKDVYSWIEGSPTPTPITNFNIQLDTFAGKT